MIRALNAMSKFEEVIVNKKTHPIIAKQRSIASIFENTSKGIVRT